MVDAVDAFERRDKDGNVNEIGSALATINLAQYTQALTALGWDSILDLQDQSREQLEAIAKSAGMLPGHAYRFATALEKKSSLTPKQSTAKSTSNKQPLHRPMPSLTSRLATSTREGSIRAAAARYVQATHTVRQANSSLAPARHAAAPDSQCGVQAGVAAQSPFCVPRILSRGPCHEAPHESTGQPGATWRELGRRARRAV